MSGIVKRDPFASLFAWPRWIDEDDFSAQRGLKIKETESDILIEAVVAGVAADKVDVNIEDGVLTIKAESKEEKKEDSVESKATYRYYYSAALSGGAWNKATAEVEHGVVHIKVPKAQAARPQKIAVKAKGE